jgi:beta-N-acetylhexosaminidase
MRQVFESRLIKVIFYLIILVVIFNLILTLPPYLQKRQLEEQITADLQLLDQLELNQDLALETSYKFNLKTANQELGIISSIASDLEAMLTQEASVIKQELQELNADLTSLEKQVLMLMLPVDLYPRDDLNDLLQNDIPQGPQLRAYFQSLITQKDQALQALNMYKEAIEQYKREQVNADGFVNELWGKSDSEIREMVRQMSPELKAAQLFIWSLNGTSLTKTELDKMSSRPQGGVILMGYNIADETQLKNFTKQIQATYSQYPFFIATDQEGGVVKRVSWDRTAGQTAWAEMSEAAICELGRQRSEILNAGGINVNLAPVVDLSVSGGGFINNRTISSDPQEVSSKAASFVKCSEENKVFTVLKHYPGHGATSQDSHFTLPVINKSKEEWLTSDAIPFKEIGSAQFIMIGHLFFKNIDPQEPSTTSSILLNDILRNEFNYQGLLISDDMNLIQRSTGISYRKLIVDSLNAGMDVLLYVGLPDSSDNVISVVTKAMENGDLKESEINNKVVRIMLAKRDLL